jgi:hypothetical protein
VIANSSALAGRTFDSGMDQSREPAAIISYAFWQRRLALDPTTIGRTFRLKRYPFEYNRAINEPSDPGIHRSFQRDKQQCRHAKWANLCSFYQPHTWRQHALPADI